MHLTETEAMSEMFADPEVTPSLEWLEQLELETRDAPGRPVYNHLLLAAIERTRQNGPQPIAGSEGRLAAYNNDEGLRARMLDRYRELRIIGEELAREFERRAHDWLRSPISRRWTNADPPEPTE